MNLGLFSIFFIIAYFSAYKIRVLLYYLNICVITVMEAHMANTEYSAAGFNVPCTDCKKEKRGANDGPRFKHSGKAVPPGTTGYFCENCAEARADDIRAGRHVRPLGVMAEAA